jgi:hypothetical protein
MLFIRSIGSQFQPLASRTLQYTKEQLGQVDDKVYSGTTILTSDCRKESKLTAPRIQTQLPPDYIDLEKRVDALKQVHQKMLSVTYASHHSLHLANTDSMH